MVMMVTLLKAVIKSLSIMRSHCHSLLLQRQKLIQNSLLLPKQNLTINNAKAALIHWRLPHGMPQTGIFI